MSRGKKLHHRISSKTDLNFTFVFLPSGPEVGCTVIGWTGGWLNGWMDESLNGWLAEWMDTARLWKRTETSSNCVVCLIPDFRIELLLSGKREN
jgi:hypothetical protein